MPTATIEGTFSEFIAEIIFLDVHTLSFNMKREFYVPLCTKYKTAIPEKLYVVTILTVQCHKASPSFLCGGCRILIK